MVHFAYRTFEVSYLVIIGRLDVGLQLSATGREIFIHPLVRRGLGGHLHAQAPAPALVPAEIVDLLFGLLAKLPELLGIFQNMRKPFLLLFRGWLGTWIRIRGLGCRDAPVVEPVA